MASPKRKKRPATRGAAKRASAKRRATAGVTAASPIVTTVTTVTTVAGDALEVQLFDAVCITNAAHKLAQAVSSDEARASALAHHDATNGDRVRVVARA